EYSGIFSVIETDGTTFCNGKDKNKKIDMSGTLPLYNYIKISNATYVTAVLDVSPENRSFEQLKETLDVFDGKTYNYLKQEHTAAFSEIFDRVTLDLCDDEENLSTEQLLLNAYNGKVDNQLIEKMTDFGRYLLISSSYGCTLPANLQGLWNGGYSPAWACTFFNNENIEMAYWQALMGNLQETLLPLFDLYERFKDDYRMNAKNLYGCRGLLLPLFMDNQSGKKDNLQPHVLYWTGSSAWISAMYYDYYLFTGDAEFLLNRAYPFMKESAQFYEDFFVLDENGKLKSYPSNSPENRANGEFEGAGETSVCINATMDFALLKELLTNLVKISQLFELNDSKVEKWQDMLSRIPEYRINEDGALCEWLHDDFKDNYHHRHQSHIYPLFPGLEVTKESDKTLFDAIKTAVDKRLIVGIKEQTGWSFAHMANIFARLGNGNKTKECLDLLLRFCTGENLFTYHNDWRNMGVTLKYMVAKQAPFQIDANMGFTSAVYEMLLYSNAQMLKFLPAIPKEFSKGKIKGIIARGGFTVDIEWQSNDVEVCITSAKDAEIDVGLTNGKLTDSTAHYAPSAYGEEFVRMSFKKGRTYKLKYLRG
ncbi:MAG: glycoside hydrolase family 95 protein, partial [Clostridia bacterium]|nr:glycoside hydrolase family 95 protein [Clostridia bacterium]